MDKLLYCLDCKLIFSHANECVGCKSTKLKELSKNAPVSILGSKQKGRVLGIRKGVIQVLIVDETKNKSIREFEPSKLRKVL